MEAIQVNEIILHLQLNKDIKYIDFPLFIANNINKILFNSIVTRLIHKNSFFKPYVVGSLYPIEYDKIYKKGQEYSLKIRTISDSFKKEFIFAAKKAYNLDFEIKEIETKRIKKMNFVDTLYTITPSVLTIRDEQTGKPRFWTKKDDIRILTYSIQNNLVKKYNEFYRTNINIENINIIDFIKIENKNSEIVFNYKNGAKIFSNKLKITFNDDEVSQTLAKLAFGVGVLEKNTLGFGMVIRDKRSK